MSIPAKPLPIHALQTKIQVLTGWVEKYPDKKKELEEEISITKKMIEEAVLQNSCDSIFCRLYM